MEDDPELARHGGVARVSAGGRARRRRSWSTDDRTPLSVAEYYACFQAAQDNMVYSLEEIEDGSGVRAGNGAGSVKADGQGTAQYGRILTGATEDVANELGITDKDTALDIGSGVGNYLEADRLDARLRGARAGAARRAGPPWARNSAAPSTRRSTNGTRSGAAATASCGGAI